MPSAGSNNSSSAIETITDVDGGGKRGQNSGGLVTFHSAPFPLGRGCSLRRARSGQGRAGVARRSEPFTARTVLRSSTRGKGGALNGPLKWPSRSPPLTAFWLACFSHVIARASKSAVKRLPGSAQDSFTTRTPCSGHCKRGGAACRIDRKSTRLNSSHGYISYAVF